MRSTKEASVDREERKRRIVTWGISTLRGDGKENTILKREIKQFIQQSVSDRRAWRLCRNRVGKMDLRLSHEFSNWGQLMTDKSSSGEVVGSKA